MLFDACNITCTWPNILTISSDMQLELISSISLFKISSINVLHGEILKLLLWSVTDSVPFSETLKQPEIREQLGSFSHSNKLPYWRVITRCQFPVWSQCPEYS